MQEIDPLGRRTTSAYDDDGRQMLRIDARGNRTTYAFDGINQQIGRRYPDGSRVYWSSEFRKWPRRRRQQPPRSRSFAVL